MSYAERGEMVGELTQGMTASNVVYGQQPGVVVVQQAPMYQQPEQVYMQPGVGGYQQPLPGVQQPGYVPQQEIVVEKQVDYE
jgi:hypothetical protein